MVSDLSNGNWERFDTPSSKCKKMNDQALILDSQQQLLTKKDLVSRHKVCERTVNYWMDRGWLSYIKIGKAVRFVPGDVERFIQSRRIGGK